MLAARQCGKTTAASCLVLWTMLTKPGSLVLILSPSQRQSIEFAQEHVYPYFDALGVNVGWVTHGVQQRRMSNGSRIVALPGKQRTIRGFSKVALLVIDEAAQVDDSLYYSVRPMISVSRGRILALSTPFGQLGWYYEAWEGTLFRGPDAGPYRWERWKVTPEMCPRLTPEILADERLSNPWYDMDYNLNFMAASGAVFRREDIEAASSGGKPSWGVDWSAPAVDEVGPDHAANGNGKH